MAEDLQRVLELDHREIDAGFEPVARGAEIDDAARAAVTRSIDGLRRHIHAEEELLFPPLRGAGLFGPVLVMLREHAEIWTVLDRLEESLGGAAGEPAELCTELLAKLSAHNEKEEQILYPQADEVVPGADAQEIVAILTDRPLPAGWTPELLRR